MRQEGEIPGLAVHVTTHTGGRMLFVGRFSAMVKVAVGAHAARLRRGCGPKREFLP